MTRQQYSRDKKLHPSAYGGVLRNRRQGRGARSVSTRFSMHLVLRSSQARGAWSFVRPKNESMIAQVLNKHAKSTNTEILGIGNAGNHLHLRLQFSTRKNYLRFIRAVTGEIALKIKKFANAARPRHAAQPAHAKIISENKTASHTFWDRRPFSSIVSTLKYVARLKDYIDINSIEGQGYPRSYARLVVQSWRYRTLNFDG